MSDHTEYEQLRERVARAIWESEHIGVCDWDQILNETRERMLSTAEAAMSTIYEAMKGPEVVQSMCEAFCELQHPDIPVEECMVAALSASPLNGGRDE